MLPSPSDVVSLRRYFKLEQKDQDCPRKAVICFRKATERAYGRSFSQVTAAFTEPSKEVAVRQEIKTQEMIYETGF